MTPVKTVLRVTTLKIAPSAQTLNSAHHATTAQTVLTVLDVQTALIVPTVQTVRTLHPASHVNIVLNPAHHAPIASIVENVHHVIPATIVSSVHHALSAHTVHHPSIVDPANTVNGHIAFYTLLKSNTKRIFTMIDHILNIFISQLLCTPP